MTLSIDTTDEIAVTPSLLDLVNLRLSSARFRAGITVPIGPGSVVSVGSGAGADLRLAEPTLSALHCRVTHRESFVEVIDLDSTNGLALGGARVSSARLWPGASIGLGAAALEVVTSASLGDDDLAGVAPLTDVVGESAPMLRLAARVRRVASTRLPVLLRGESGTGKELVAGALHTLSGRSGAFVALNAATIAGGLAESELFGHKRGAFTGAVSDRRGAFTQAHGGTLFLDEIGALALDVQAKLLRAVEDGGVRVLGAEQPVSVDVRLIAATCDPLEELVSAGRFRHDLYQRLASCVLRLPPLRERRPDLPLLARALLERAGFQGTGVDRGALRVLEGQAFPGNIRELRNVLAQAAVLAGPCTIIAARHVLDALAERGVAPCRPGAAEIVRAYERARGNASAAARVLGIPRTTVRDAVKRHRSKLTEPSVRTSEGSEQRGAL